jgi:6-pyruvoyltetrahydropterin/6-carboxytetrahydropterin synthase
LRRKVKVKKAMYEITVEKAFEAAHHLISLRGSPEPHHGHSYRAQLTVRGRELDGEDLLVDFRELRDALDAACAPLHYANLNELPDFRGRNTSAENLARWIFEGVKRRLQEANLRVEVASCVVWEAPGVSVRYQPDMAP